MVRTLAESCRRRVEERGAQVVEIEECGLVPMAPGGPAVPGGRPAPRPAVPERPARAAVEDARSAAGSGSRASSISLAAGLDDAPLGPRRGRARLQRDDERTARGRASWCPGPASTSRTCSGRRTSTRSGSSATRPRRRMPSMMAPTAVLGPGGEVELVLGSAGLEPDPLGHPADRRQRPGPRHGRGGRRAGRPRCTSRRPPSTPSRRSTTRPCGRRATTPPAPAPATSSSAGCRRSQRDPATGALRGGGDPRRGGAVVAA